MQAPHTTSETLDLLQRYESRNVLYRDPDGTWPIVWERASGCKVWDVEGREYLDLTAAFGVAAAGHANPAVVAAGQRQMETLLHAMGDVHPHRAKAMLLRRLSEITFEKWGAGPGKCILGSAGFESVEAALKTALMATGRSRIISFEGAYHGLGYGALTATHRGLFRNPFRPQLTEFADVVPFPSADNDLPTLRVRLATLLQRGVHGAILVEPIQARGGIRIPPAGFLSMLREVCDEHGALLILDEIYTGFGRTGAWFACEHESVVPDLICLGKALTGGFPLSACVGSARLMDRAWPASEGEAIHTSTFLGHPVGCAMACAQLDELNRLNLTALSKKRGDIALRRLQEISKIKGCFTARGIGLMLGLELRDIQGKPDGSRSIRVIKKLLQRGFILLPEGEHGEVISLTPPLTIEPVQLNQVADALEKTLGDEL